MVEAQEQRRFEQACRALARLLVPKNCRSALSARSDLHHLTSRFSTLHILLDDEIEALQASRSRSDAIALILATDFVWQTVRVFACREGNDRKWLHARLPADQQASERDSAGDHYARQKKIVDDATWVFELHSALRHPGKENHDLLQILRDPVGEDVRERLLRAARAIKQVLLSTQVDLDPTVRVVWEPVER